MPSCLKELKLVLPVRKREAWHYNQFSDCISRPACIHRKKKKVMWDFIEIEKVPPNSSGAWHDKVVCLHCSNKLGRPLSFFAL